MSAPPKTVGQYELAFFFQTNEPIPARPLLNFLYEVERIARTRRHLGPSAVVEISEIQTGTKLVRLTFDRKLALATLAVAVVALGNDLIDRMQQRSGRLAESIAEMCLDHGVAECVVTTPEVHVRITRDQLPAITTVQERRDFREAPRMDMPDAESVRAPSAVGSAATEHAQLGAEELVRPLDDLRYDQLSRLDGRIYTIIGKLQPPGSAGHRVPARYWQFDSLSGRTYIASGINPERARIPRTATVVIRAEIVGDEAGITVLNVRDVFETEEP